MQRVNRCVINFTKLIVNVVIEKSKKVQSARSYGRLAASSALVAGAIAPIAALQLEHTTSYLVCYINCLLLKLQFQV